MPRFYFHIFDGRDFTDNEGIELADLSFAKIEALRLAGGILRDERPVEIWNGQPWIMNITQNAVATAGPILLTLSITAHEI